jgi:hypothetical protein
MKYTLCLLGIISLLLVSCNDKLKIEGDQSTSFVKNYGNLWEDNGYDIKSLPISGTFPHGGYVLTGSTTNSVSGNKGDKDMLFLILDQYGNIVGKPKQFGGSGDDEARRVDILPGSSGFILTGYTTSADGQRHAYIVRLNPTGTDTIWTWKSSIAGSSSEEALSLHIDSVTKIYTCVGYQTYNSQQYGWIFDIDDNGKLNTSSWDTLSISSIQSLSANYSGLNVKYTDIGLLSSPYIGLFGGFTSQNTPGLAINDKSVLFIAKKQLGKYSVANNYTNANNAILSKLNESPKQMIVLPGNKGAYLSSIDSINSSLLSVHLALFDSPDAPAGSLITNWYYFDSPGGNLAGGSLDAAKMKYNAGDNTFIILATLTPTTQNTSIVLLKIDGTNGSEIWRRTFGVNDNYGAGGLDITPDGGYIITGYNNTGAYNQSVLVIKTNKDGFIE